MHLWNDYRQVNHANRHTLRKQTSLPMNKNIHEERWAKSITMRKQLTSRLDRDALVWQTLKCWLLQLISMQIMTIIHSLAYMPVVSMRCACNKDYSRSPTIVYARLFDRIALGESLLYIKLSHFYNGFFALIGWCVFICSISEQSFVVVVVVVADVRCSALNTDA